MVLNLEDMFSRLPTETIIFLGVLFLLADPSQRELLREICQRLINSTQDPAELAEKIRIKIEETFPQYI